MDDLYLEIIKKAEKSDRCITNGLTNSDHIPKIIDASIEELNRHSFAEEYAIIKSPIRFRSHLMALK
jgi:hypothetical protein